ncbi:MAG: SAF domain-containing protein [Luteococcus sp.]|uniref:SAF domain-containing protein n=1 Tax=Luteococcus sp. TaxID=1969402 RepID=UPI002648986D|nr:SAF domain-containing protein [Luteococcus sp.]MDN5562573.1 SAF domain-containing protein [Luteococcus sp.]
MVKVSWPRGSSKNAKQTGSSAAPQAVPSHVAANAQIRMQRSPLRIALAILCIVLAALGAAWGATKYRNTTDVVSVRQPVSRGEIIKREDLQSASITLDPALHTIPKSQLESLVGKRAASDLPSGALVTPDSVSSDTFPPKGGSVVGIYLSNGQLPQTTLRAGATVRLVATPKSQDDMPANSAQQTTFTATVVQVRQQGDSTHSSLDVLVSSNQATQVAALAATQRLAVILDGE